MFSWQFIPPEKYLFIGIDLEKSVSKGLKTLAFCWVYRKRVFSVSGSFLKALTDLITDLHNSNKPLVQVTLFGEELFGEEFFLLGFVVGKDIQIDENIWFTALTSSQISVVNAIIEKKTFFIRFRLLLLSI